VKPFRFLRYAAALILLGAGFSAAAQVQFNCTFSSSPTECGFNEQSFSLPRATIMGSVGRDGGTSVQLKTLPGDSNVAGSGSNERDDLSLSQANSNCFAGQEAWWAHSIRLPDGYVPPPGGATWNWGTLFDFHHTGSTGQPNFQIVAVPTGLEFRGAGGAAIVNGPNDPGYYAAAAGAITKNTWYDFVYHVKWSSGSDGYFQAWVNGVRKLNYSGPTLYAGQGCYLKLANYHTPLGVSVSVIHDRVMRGTTPESVALTPLEGVNSSADTTPPTVSLTSPLPATTVSGALTMTASASDNVGIAGVQFKYNGINTGSEQTTAPYTIVADTTTVANGSYSLTAVARDAAGNTTTSAPVVITVSNGVTPPADTTPPSVPGGLSASVASTSQINLTWSASTDSVGVTGYNVYRGGVQIATTTSPSYNNTGLAASTAYSYTVAAYDAAGNNSAQSGAISATTLTPADTTPPSVPGGLSANVASTSQINLSWSASTDSVGVTGYKVYRGGTQIATTTSPSYNNTGLASSTAYSYTVASYDAAGNNSAQSGAVLANTLTPPDTTAPSVPGALSANAASASQINLSWGASTDNVGVTGYKVFRGGTQIATTTSPSYNNTGLAASTAYSYTVASYDVAGNQSAQSAAASATTPAAGATGATGATGDVNGDGMSDILWRNAVTGQNAVWFMNGATLVSSADLATVADLNWKIAGKGDFDGDGNADILWRNGATGQNQIWLMKGATLSAAVTVAGSSNLDWKVAGIGDFDGDGKADIVWRNSQSGQNQLWLMDGGTIRSSLPLDRVVSSSWSIVAVGDFDGDKKADLLWRHKTTGQNQIWFMNGGTLLSAPNINSVKDLNWSVIGAGDFDGNGKSDVLWRNKATGENSIFFMNGSTVLSTTFINQVADLNWEIAALGDFNGDGKSDVLWRNRATGENSIFFMNGGTVTSITSVTSVPATEWTITPR
jgi:chitodextrinase